MIEVGQDVGAPLGQGPGRLGDLLQPVGTACLRELMSRCIRSSPGPGSWAR